MRQRPTLPGRLQPSTIGVLGLNFCVRNGKYLADVGNEDVLGIHAHRLGQTGMRLQMALLAVDGDEEAGLQKPMDDLQLLLAGVAGDVQALELVIDDLCALAVELIDDLADGFFVAGMAPTAQPMLRAYPRRRRGPR